MNLALRARLAVPALVAFPIAAQSGFGTQQVISTGADWAQSVFASDLDGDGYLDVLSASGSDDKIAWFKNLGSFGDFGPGQTISTAADFPQAIYSADLDGDGDQDVLSASKQDDTIAWYENTDGEGTFGPLLIITDMADTAWSVTASDLDSDGDMDVLSASYGDDKISWYENIDGLGAFGPQRVISVMADGARSVFAADLDGDGDDDVLSASVLDDKIAWYENTDGLGTFGPQVVITTEADIAFSVFAADLDSDGDRDVLSASDNDGKIAWYENVDGLGHFGAQQVITAKADGARSVRAMDLNGDGAPDVLSAAYSGSALAWYENTDGLGSFGAQQVISPDGANATTSVFSAELDGDGDLDVLSASSGDDKIAWYQNLMGPFDCDGDGVPDYQEVAAGSPDCNANGIPDECEIADGTSADIDLDGVPDECQQVLITDVAHLLAFATDPVVVTGVNFDGATTVDLDGNPAPVASWTPTTLTIQPTPADPGLLDITVTNTVSSVTIPDGLSLWPTLSASTTGVGGTVDVLLDNGEPGLYGLAFATGTFPAPLPITSPPTWYGVVLDITGPTFLLTTGAFATTDPVALSYPIPDVPAWAGISLYFQAWCQQGFFGTGVTYSFTNLAAVTL